jgi:spermidine synthase
MGVVVTGLGVVGMILLSTVLNPSRLPAIGMLDARKDEVMLKAWEGSDCTVSVVRDKEGLSIKINSDYGLGSTAARDRQACQAEIPLMLKPDARSVFFLGMGTGITAGAALSERFPKIERVVTCELSPHVVTASREFMTQVDGRDLTQGLFTDKRSTVLTEDGRHHLMATAEKYDVIAADLFVPYRSCAGSLYSVEHFQSVRQRLEKGGIFVQWLPAYQLTEFDFHVIGRTMLEVFDQVTLLRCDFAPFDEVVAFVGHEGAEPLPACAIDDARIRRAFLEANGRMDIYETLNPQTVMLYYAGNVSASRERFADYPVNRDDCPVIEYLAPRHYRNKGEEQMPWFVGPYLLKFIKDLQAACPPDRDPMLIKRSPANRRLSLAGSTFHEMRLWVRVGKQAEAEASWRKFVGEWMGKAEN